MGAKAKWVAVFTSKIYHKIEMVSLNASSRGYH